MRTATAQILIRRSPEEVFEVLEELPDYPRFFVGITKWEPLDEVAHDVGDRYWILMATGANSVGGVVRIGEFERPSRISWVSEQGTEHTMDITLASVGNATRVRFALSYSLAGALPARFIEWLSSSMLERNLVATLEALRHLCEWGPAEGLGSQP